MKMMMMRFCYSIILVVAFAAASLFDIIPKISAETVECKPTEYQESIDSYEIRKVGYGSVPAAQMVVFDNGELNGEVYFEVDPNHFDYNTIVDATTTTTTTVGGFGSRERERERLTTPTPEVFVELYAVNNLDADADTDADLDDNSNADSYCDTGTTLIDTDTVDSSIYTYQFDNDEYTSLLFDPQEQNECFPRTTNGIVMAVEFNFTDVFYTEPSSMTILHPMYYQGNGTDTSSNIDDDGLLQFCVRVGFKQQRNNDDAFELISFLDTMIRVDVNLTSTTDNNTFTFNSPSSSSSHAQAQAQEQAQDDDKEVVLQQMIYYNIDYQTTTTTTTTTTPTTTPTQVSPSKASSSTTTTDSTATNSPTYSPTSLSLSTIDQYVLRVVGEEGGKPLGQITSLDPIFSGIGFFEVHPSQFEGEGGINSAITIELFTTLKNVPETETTSRSCDQGVLLESIPENGFLIETETIEFPNYNEVFEDSAGDGLYPTSSNGKIIAAKYSISDYTSSEPQIYFPGSGDGTKNTIEYCLRVSLKLDFTGNGEKEYVSYLDSFQKVNVILDGAFGGTTFDEQKVGQTSADQRTGSLNDVIADPYLG